MASYETGLSESRTGANVTEGELMMCDRLLRDLTDRGQSIHAAMANNPDRFTFSLKTAYRHVNGALLEVRPKPLRAERVRTIHHDLRRRVVRHIP
jgi:hypothetical protein